MCAKGITVKGVNDVFRSFRRYEREVGRTIKDTVKEFMEKVMADAMANLPQGSQYLRSSYRIEVTDSGYTAWVYSDDELAAYVEFGTGVWARTYLSGKPVEMVREAIKFYINGKGTMFAQPYLFPAYYKYVGWFEPELKQRLDRIKV